MSSVAVQTDEIDDDTTNINSLSMGLFTQILSILDDEQSDFFYDISDERLKSDSKWSVCADSGSNLYDHSDIADNSTKNDYEQPNQDEQEQINVGNLSTIELENSIQISEIRLRNNLDELGKITSDEHIKEWLHSTEITHFNNDDDSNNYIDTTDVHNKGSEEIDEELLSPSIFSQSEPTNSLSPSIELTNTQFDYSQTNSSLASNSTQT